MALLCYTNTVKAEPLSCPEKGAQNGKSLNGKECGKGIYQRKDGKYHARFDDRFGKSHGKYGKTLPEACNRLEEASCRDKHGSTFTPTGELTVDQNHHGPVRPYH